MEKTTINDVDPHILSGGGHRRGLSESLGTTNIAVNHYRLAPGEGLPGGLHTHMDQEELFAVIKGEATFKTMDGEVSVDEGEVVRFSPGEFQTGKNEADRELMLFALGAPRNTEDIRIPVECPECSHDDLRLDISEDGTTFVCPDCDTKHIPQDCPKCGHDDLHITLNEEGQTVVICQGCRANFENPPIQAG